MSVEIFILDGAKMTDVAEAHAYIARTMRFPSYYGRNLDALADCLSVYGKSTVIILTNEKALRDSLGDYADRLLSVFQELSTAPNSFSFVIVGD